MNTLIHFKQIRNNYLKEKTTNQRFQRKKPPKNETKTKKMTNDET